MFLDEDPDEPVTAAWLRRAMAEKREGRAWTIGLYCCPSAARNNFACTEHALPVQVADLLVIASEGHGLDARTLQKRLKIGRAWGGGQEHQG